MASKNQKMGRKAKPDRDRPPTGRVGRGPVVTLTRKSRSLDSVQLGRLETSFRDWAADSVRPDLIWSRKRILLIFLLIRYAGAKLNEVLALNPVADMDLDGQTVFFGQGERGGRPLREIHLAEALAFEIRSLLDDPTFQRSPGKAFRVDPGHVRRKFYERAAACGFPTNLGSPEGIRKSRAVELLESNVPLPVVQNIMGYGTPNLASALVSYSVEDLQQAARFFVERESSRKTSARNAFFGKIETIQKGDIQSQVELITIGGNRVATVITNESLTRLGFKIGMLITAEVKAPHVILEKTDKEPRCTAENRFQGTIARINRGRITTEYVVQMVDGTSICSLVSSETSRRLGLQENEPVWALFNSFSVVLHRE